MEIDHPAFNDIIAGEGLDEAIRFAQNEWNRWSFDYVTGEGSLWMLGSIDDTWPKHVDQCDPRAEKDISKLPSPMVQPASFSDMAQLSVTTKTSTLGAVDLQHHFGNLRQVHTWTVASMKSMCQGNDIKPQQSRRSGPGIALIFVRFPSRSTNSEGFPLSTFQQTANKLRQPVEHRDPRLPFSSGCPKCSWLLWPGAMETIWP